MGGDAHPVAGARSDSAEAVPEAEEEGRGGETEGAGGTRPQEADEQEEGEGNRRDSVQGACAAEGSKILITNSSLQN